jgi:hypothetical protein
MDDYQQVRLRLVQQDRQRLLDEAAEHRLAQVQRRRTSPMSRPDVGRLLLRLRGVRWLTPGIRSDEASVRE